MVVTINYIDCLVTYVPVINPVPCESQSVTVLSTKGNIKRDFISLLVSSGIYSKDFLRPGAITHNNLLYLPAIRTF